MSYAKSNDTELKSELAAPTYKFDAAGRKVLEPKEKLKERGLRSPDMADSLALTFAFPVRPVNAREVKRITELDRLNEEWL